MTRAQSENSAISAEDPHPRRRVSVRDTEMSYVDTGTGDPIVFLHGNPTSSYLWRNIIPFVIGQGRCLAPDLVGMGQSGPQANRQYRFIDHAGYLDAWFAALGLAKNVILVVHDWGSALGFYRAMRFPEQVRAIAYMEAIARPRRWAEFGDAAGIFRALRSEQGERLVLDENAFIEKVLPMGTVRQLSAGEMAAYQKPFLLRESRHPMLAWPREIPIAGDPPDVVELVERYGQWMSRVALPKLLILGDPGAIVTGETRAFCRTWPNQSEVTVRGRHFLPEDSPFEIGAALAQFIRDLSRTSEQPG